MFLHDVPTIRAEHRPGRQRVTPAAKAPAVRVPWGKNWKGEISGKTEEHHRNSRLVRKKSQVWGVEDDMEMQEWSFECGKHVFTIQI